MNNHVIWTNMEDFDEWMEDYKNEIEESVWGEWSIDDFYDEFNEYIDMSLGDERSNLDIETNGIIAIADIGLWNGRVKGYKEIGTNISDCLYSECDYIKWFVDQYGRFCCTESHHDGTNYIIYKEWKDNVTDEQKEMVLNKILCSECSERIIRRYMNNLGYKIAQVYGWNLNRRK